MNLIFLLYLGKRAELNSFLLSLCPPVKEKWALQMEPMPIIYNLVQLRQEMHLNLQAIRNINAMQQKFAG